MDKPVCSACALNVLSRSAYLNSVSIGKNEYA
jgi:hypothetical protein